MAAALIKLLATMLILNRDRSDIDAFIRDGVTAFLGEFPNAQPTCIALYASPVNGWVSLCLDVADNETAPATSCANYSHVEYRLLERPAWSAEYESPHPIVQQHDSTVVKLAPIDDDDTYNKAFFFLLMKVLNDYYQSGSGVFRPKWAGVQILDSRYSSFWRVHGNSKMPDELIPK